MSLAGLDVSSYQGGAIDWRKVAGGGYVFAFVKASEGASIKGGEYWDDPTFTGNRNRAKAAGLVVAAYHFARPGTTSPELEAEHFAARLGELGAGDLPPALDLEFSGGLDPAALEAWALAFLRRLSALRPERAPLVYTYPSFLTDHLAGGRALLAEFGLWWARYHPTLVPGDPAPVFWQYTSSGAVPGITGRVDLDRFMGSPAQLAALAAGHPAPRPAPAPAPHPTIWTSEAPDVHTVNLKGASAARIVAGPGVRALQSLLILAGFLRGPIDGKGGPGTRAALGAFQAHHGLAVDYIAGPQTFAVLDAQ